MAYFILFLFVAYVAPVFFLKGLEAFASSRAVEPEKSAENSQEPLVSAPPLTLKT